MCNIALGSILKQRSWWGRETPAAHLQGHSYAPIYSVPSKDKKKTKNTKKYTKNTKKHKKGKATVTHLEINPY